MEACRDPISQVLLSPVGESWRRNVPPVPSSKRNLFPPSSVQSVGEKGEAAKTRKPRVSIRTLIVVELAG